MSYLLLQRWKRQPLRRLPAARSAGFLGHLCAEGTAAVAGAVNSGLAELSDLENDVADKIAEELGLQQWYSLHVTNQCDGNFNVNSSTVLNRTHCTDPLKSGKYAVPDGLSHALTNPANFNLSGLLDHPIDIGSIHINLADFTQQIQDKIDKIPNVFQIISAFYICFLVGATLALGFSPESHGAQILSSDSVARMPSSPPLHMLHFDRQRSHNLRCNGHCGRDQRSWPEDWTFGIGWPKVPCLRLGSLYTHDICHNILVVLLRALPWS